MSLTPAKRRTPEQRANLQRIGTPDALFRYLDASYGFTLDACAEPWSAKCEHYFTKEQNSLEQDWGGHIVFCNPPYEDIEPWIHKAFLHGVSEGDATTVLLLPVRTDRDWFLDYQPVCEVMFLRGRWTMQRPPDWGGKWSSGGFPLMTMTFGPDVQRGRVYCDSLRRDHIIETFGLLEAA